MKAWPAVLGIGVLLTGCTGATPTTSAPPVATAASTAGATTASGSPTAASPSASSAPTPGQASGTPTARPPLILSGTSIGDRPLGSTPSSRLEPELTARFGTPRVGRVELCHVVGERNQFALVDHRFGGLTVHYARRGGTTLAIGWQVLIERVPDGLRLVDRLEWRPTFAALATADGVVVDTAAGVTTAVLTGRAISYSGTAGTDHPDTVTGGPNLSCR